MGTTPNRLLPYAEPSDAVAEYPATDKAAMEKLDTLLFDTGWVNVTINPGFAVWSTNTPRVRRIGNVVYGQGGWGPTGLTASGTFTVGVLPAGFTPLISAFMRAGTSAGAVAATMIMNAGTGTIDMRLNASVGSWYAIPAMAYVIN
jgi:hypothetical protein